MGSADQWRGGLSGVRVFATCVDLEFLEHLAAESCLGQHATHGLLNDPLGMLGHHRTDRAKFQPAGVARVGLHHALLGFATGQHDLGGVGHDDVVAAVDMRCPVGPMFAHQHTGNFHRHAAKHLSVGINMTPSRVGFAGLQEGRLTGHDADSPKDLRPLRQGLEAEAMLEYNKTAVANHSEPRRIPHPLWVSRFHGRGRPPLPAPAAATLLTMSQWASRLRGPRRPLTVLSWLVIVATTGLLMVLAAMPPDAGVPPKRGGGDQMLKMEARLVLAQEALVPGSGMAALAEIDLSNAPGRRLRLAAVAAAINGPEAGRAIVIEVQQGLAGRDLEPTEFQGRVIDELDRVFAGTASEAVIEELQKDLGWFGQMAVLASEDGGDGRQQRLAPLLDDALSTLIVLLTVMAGLGLVGLVGLVLLILGTIVAFQGELRSRLHSLSSHDGIYAETFAIWLIAFSIILIAAAILAEELPKHLALVVSIIGFFVSLGVLAWPVIRGVPWESVRRDIGWTRGRGFGIELGCGVVGYAAALPIAAVGLLISILLILLAAPEEGASSAAHPIVGELAGGGWGVRIQVLLMASVAAPVVEETMFRGVLYRQVRSAAGQLAPWLSIAAAAGATSLIFALIHPQGLLAVPALASLAVAFSLAREWRGSLIAPMVMHGVSNGIVMAMLMVMLG